MSALNHQTDHKLEIDFDATQQILDTLNSIGRTEDLAFSPDNSKLAIACYAANKILLIDIALIQCEQKPKITLQNLCEINSRDLNYPHGVAWLNNYFIIVANRFTQPTIFKIPDKANLPKKLELDALQTLPRINRSAASTLDCIDAHPLGNGFYEVFICSNSGHYVSHYILDESKNFAARAKAYLIRKNLKIPDGIKVSADGKWLAVSNHQSHQVFVYKNTDNLNIHSSPDAILENINYPHGITFSNDQKLIYVSDAGAPYVNVYGRNSNEWSGNYLPSYKIQVMNDETFRIGNKTKQEGGSKGIDMMKNAEIIATTCSTKSLAFFQTGQVKEDNETFSNTYSSMLEKQTEIQMTKAFLRISENMILTMDELVSFREYMKYRIKSSTIWKLTLPLRMVKNWWLNLRQS